nr:ribonuclease H-like domain-containing protein [Tanacetum cinerariifolium]
MTLPNPQRYVVPIAILTKSKLVPITTARPVTIVVPKPHVTRPRQAKTVVTKPHTPPRRHINRIPSPKASTFPPKVTAAKAPMGNLQHAFKDKEVIDSGCSRHMIGNMSYMFDFEELNGGYVAFGGNPKGGKISGKGKIRTGKLDFDDVYFVKELKPRPAKTIVTKPQSPPRRTINRRPSYAASNFPPKVTTVKAPKVNDVKGVQENWDKRVIDSRCSRHITGNMSYLTDFEEINDGCVAFGGNPKGGKISGKGKIKTDAAFEVKEPEFKGRKPQSEVHVSPSSSAQTKKHDDKNKREDKGKIPIESSTGYRNLSTEFEDFSDNSINEIKLILHPTHGKYLYVDTSQLLDDPNMPKLEDITYSDDKEDVGAEADFTNLETTITISPIPTTRVHKDHPVTQIIEEPKRVHQALKDPSWIKAMQEELLQFKMQKVWFLVDLPYEKRAIGTKWVFRNKKDERGIVVMNKAQLVAQGHTQEEGIDYEEVFAPVA